MMIIQPLHQTGHATDGFSRFSASSPVSRLLSFSLAADEPSPTLMLTPGASPLDGDARTREE
jgi:hypothetical protein